MLLEGEGEKKDLPGKVHRHTEHEGKQGRELAGASYLSLCFKDPGLLCPWF